MGKSIRIILTIVEGLIVSDNTEILKELLRLRDKQEEQNIKLLKLQTSIDLVAFVIFGSIGFAICYLIWH
jgi:hypothetical protein